MSLARSEALHTFLLMTYGYKLGGGSLNIPTAADNTRGYLAKWLIPFMSNFRESMSLASRLRQQSDATNHLSSKSLPWSRYAPFLLETPGPIPWHHEFCRKIRETTVGGHKNAAPGLQKPLDDVDQEIFNDGN